MFARWVLTTPGLYATNVRDSWCRKDKSIASHEDTCCTYDTQQSATTLPHAEFSSSNSQPTETAEITSRPDHLVNADISLTLLLHIQRSKSMFRMRFFTVRSISILAPRRHRKSHQSCRRSLQPPTNRQKYFQWERDLFGLKHASLSKPFLSIFSLGSSYELITSEKPCTNLTNLSNMAAAIFPRVLHPVKLLAYWLENICVGPREQRLRCGIMLEAPCSPH